MRNVVIISAAFALAFAASGVQAQKMDKNGRCHAASGEFAKADVCAGVTGSNTPPVGTEGTAPSKGPAMAGPSMKGSSFAPAASEYKLDAKGKCHDAKGKMARKALCGK